MIQSDTFQILSYFYDEQLYIVVKRRKMRRVAWLILIMMMISGCAEIQHMHMSKVYDKIPTGESKGYVGFYGYRIGGGIENFPVYYRVIENGKEKKLGSFNFISTQPQEVICAMKPGTYSFRIYLGNQQKNIEAEIVNGKITPIKSVFTITGSKKYIFSETTTYSGLWELKKEEPISFSNVAPRCFTLSEWEEKQ